MLAGLSLIHKLLYGSAVVLILALSAALFMADRRADKWEGQTRKANAELQRISTAKNEQRKETGRNIERVRVVEKDAGKRAERVEQAPVELNCKTPEAVLQADL